MKTCSYLFIMAVAIGSFTNANADQFRPCYIIDGGNDGFERVLFLSLRAIEPSERDKRTTKLENGNWLVESAAVFMGNTGTIHTNGYDVEYDRRKVGKSYCEGIVKLLGKRRQQSPFTDYDFVNKMLTIDRSAYRGEKNEEKAFDYSDVQGSPLLNSTFR